MRCYHEEDLIHRKGKKKFGQARRAEEENILKRMRKFRQQLLDRDARGQFVDWERPGLDKIKLY